MVSKVFTPSNAFVPILVTSGNAICTNPLPLNAWDPIDVTAPSITISVNNTLFVNVYSPMFVTPDGMRYVPSTSLLIDFNPLIS